MTKFNLDRNNVPEVVFDNSWPLRPEGKEAIYQVGEWSLSKWDDAEPQDALNAIYSWIAWYEFLTKDNK
jgi:hypothetical protein